MVELPSNWSDWKVTGELGSGSYSTVYEAERKDDPSIRCAIKIMTIPQDDDEYDDLMAEGFSEEQSKSFFDQAIQDYVREIRLMEHFKGTQNIVSIEDYRVEPRDQGFGSTIYIRMELLSPLEKYLSDKKLMEQEVIQLGVDICNALEICGKNDIIHRDIKPANIFVNDKLGTRAYYKLGDFGIARSLEGKTQGLTTRGTPNYMAPEVAAGLPYSSTADLYSLGLTMYWLLNEYRLPFLPSTQLFSPAIRREALQRRLSGEKIPPPINATPKTAEVILKACSYRDENRFQTADEMKQALLHLQIAKNSSNDSPEMTERPQQRRTIKASTRVSKWIYAAASVAALIMMIYFLLPPLLNPPSEPLNIEQTSWTVSSSVTPAIDKGKAEKNIDDNAAQESKETSLSTSVISEPTPTDELEATPTIQPGTPEEIANTEINRVFESLQKQVQEFQDWGNKSSTEQIIIPEHRSDLPAGIDLSMAPSISLTKEDKILTLQVSDVYCYQRQISVSTGDRPLSCTYQPEQQAYIIEWDEELDIDQMIIVIDYHADSIRTAFTYSVATAMDNSLSTSCLETATVFESKENQFSLIHGALEDHCMISFPDQDIQVRANYILDKLSGYEDITAGAIYRPDGYLQSGSVPAGYQSPIVIDDGSGNSQENKQRELYKKVQALYAECLEITQYHLSNKIYIPDNWTELMASSITVEDAPALEIVREGDQCKANILDAGNRWEVYVRDATVSLEGNNYLFRILPEESCEIDVKLEAQQGLVCSMHYQEQNDGTMRCVEIKTICYLDQSLHGIELNESKKARREGSSFELIDLDEYFWTYSVAFREKLDMESTLFSYGFVGGDMILWTKADYGLGRRQTYPLLQESIALKSDADQRNGIVHQSSRSMDYWIHEGQLYRADRQMTDNQCPALSTLNLETLTMNDASPFLASQFKLLHQWKLAGSAGNQLIWNVIELRNETGVTVRVADQAMTNQNVRSYPEIISPNETFFVIYPLESGSYSLYMFQTEEKGAISLSVEKGNTVSEAEWYPQQVNSNRETQLWNIINLTNYRLNRTDLICFETNSYGEKTRVTFPGNQGMSVPLSAGETMELFFPGEAITEGGIELHAWGYLDA